MSWNCAALPEKAGDQPVVGCMSIPLAYYAADPFHHRPIRILLKMNIWAIAVLSTTFMLSAVPYVRNKTPYSARRLNAIFYNTSLAFTLTAIGVFTAARAGLIDSAGRQIAAHGYLVMKILDFLIDLVSDGWLAILVPVVVLLPQGLCYLTGLPFGISSKPQFGVDVLDFATWMIAKGLGTTACITLSLLVLSLFGQVELPPSMRWNGLAIFVTLLSWAVGLITVRYYILEVLLGKLWRFSWLNRLHRKAIRNRDPESDRDTYLTMFVRKWLAAKEDSDNLGT